MAISKTTIKRPTLADVARNCGITAATVSRVLNHKTKNFSATPAVRQRIYNATKELGYVPELNARSLSQHDTRVIGLFASPQTHFAEGINEPLIEGLVETLHASGYEVFYGLTPAWRVKNSLPVWHFDGAILMQAPTHETVQELEIRRVPYVCVNERVGRPVTYILADDAMGMNRAVSYLKQLGHQRIAYANLRVSNTAAHYSVRERHETLLSAAKKKAIHVVSGHDAPFNSAEQFIRTTILEEHATAIITYDHRLAVTILGAAYAMGLQVPRDFSLVCFNDSFPVAMLNPPLTTIAVAGREMGRLGAEQLLHHLLSPRPIYNKEIRVPEDLIIRGSTGSPGQ